MQMVMIFICFVVLAFCAVGLLSAMSIKTTNRSEEPLIIKSITSDLIEKIKKQYILFCEAICNKDMKLLKKVCTNDFTQALKIDMLSSEKIVCILEAKVLNLNKNEVEIHFISRNINTEIIENRCKFQLVSANCFLISEVF